MRKETKKKVRILGAVLFFLYLLALTYFLFFAEGYGRSVEGRMYAYNLQPFREIKRFWVQLVFEDGALEAIAEKALEKKTGARALRAIIEDFMLDIMYEIPKDDSIGKVTITRDYIEHKGGPLIEMRGVPALEE